MSGAWRPVWGHYALTLKLTRVHWFINVFVGVIVPALVYVIYAQRLPVEARPRLLVGSVLFSGLGGLQLECVKPGWTMHLSRPSRPQLR